jgi:hypothetical protein
MLIIFFFFLRPRDMGLAGNPALEPSTSSVLQARLQLKVKNKP